MNINDIAINKSLYNLSERVSCILIAYLNEINGLQWTSLSLKMIALR